MLTSSANQYLRPEYLTPLPTTLDAKKSPLALLAQTCSQIGADTSSTKNLIPPLEKKKLNVGTEGNSGREKNSPASTSSSSAASDRASSKSHGAEKSSKEEPAVLNLGINSAEEQQRKSTVRTPVSKSSSPSVGSPSPKTTAPTSTAASSEPTKSESTAASSVAATSSASVLSSSAKLNFNSVLSASADPALKDIPLGTYKPALHGLHGLGYHGSLTGHLPLDAVSTATTLPVSLMTQSNALASLKHSSLAPGLNPYLSYARLKTPTGGEALVPVCRDPYCAGCQLSTAGGPNAHLLKGTCPSGCVQCDHQKTGFSSLSSLMPGMPPSAAAAAAAAALGYTPPHSFLGGPLPYVCNWIQGDAYCGKRFSTSEELLQHLRSHTNLNTVPESSLLPLLNPASLPPHPLLSSAAALHRTYPTPPLSPLSAARYHPYSKPSLPGLPGLPGSLSAASLSGLPPHPAMAPYYSPYALYGQRLGAAGLHQ